MDEEEEKALLRELGLSSANEIYNDEKSVSSSRHVHPAIPLGLGVFGIVNVAFLLSLPPVLRGKGTNAWTHFFDQRRTYQYSD
jgi:hypothetical protein